MVNMPPDLVDRTPYQTILYQKNSDDERIATIVLNRPEKLNAMSFDMMLDIKHALITAERDPEVKVVIIKGAGRLFSTGYDLNAPPGFGEGLTQIMASEDDTVYHHHNVRFTVWNLQKPVIAQVHGYCLAGASDFAMVCDITIAADDAIFGNAPARSRSTGAGLFPWFCQIKKAKYLALSGDPITGKEAAEIGLATMSVPAAELEERTMVLARRLAMIPGELLFLNKYVCNKSIEIMGLRSAQDVMAKIHDYGHTFEPSMEWVEKAEEAGMRGAIEWRDKKFGDDVRGLKKAAGELGALAAFPQVLSLPQVKAALAEYEKIRKQQPKSGDSHGSATPLRRMYPSNARTGPKGAGK